MNQNNDAEDFKKYERSVMKSVVKDLIAWKAVSSGLTALAIVWATYFMLTNKEFGFSEIVPEWAIPTGLLFGVMLGLSGLSTVILSLRSLLPAILLWVAGLAIIVIQGPSDSSVYVFIAAVISTGIYQISPIRPR